jgi:deferrochelatase/peroxidase EfeB
MSAGSVDLSGVQATLVAPYKRPIAVHLPFRFGTSEGARAFVHELRAQLTMAKSAPDATADPLVNLGITCAGLQALGVDPAIVGALDLMYQRGPDAARLGDVPGSPSAPDRWWEGQFATEDIHCVVHLYLRESAGVAPAVEHVRSLAAQHDAAELRPRANGELLMAQALGGRKVHFGYKDGISQPEIGWDDAPDTLTRVNFRRFVLGHATDEYRSQPRDGPAAEFVRDSFYGVFRWLYQDVAAFNRYLRDNGPSLSADDGEELLAAKMMGRWRDGTPLMLADAPNAALTDANDFVYAGDPHGLRCPFSAHIRVVNPRDDRLDPVVGTTPRVIRRGMPYGPELTGTTDDGRDRGLIGVFLCADITQQIYKLTGWINRNDFRPRDANDPNAQDAIAGNRSSPGAGVDFVVPTDDGNKTLPSLADFVRTKGTAFLLYPSDSTLGRIVDSKDGRGS